MTIFESTLNGVPVSIETGKIAKQANGAVTVKYGETVAIVTACASKKNDLNAPFFPLTCSYSLKYYANGKIPGGFIKRETKPSDDETLVSRMIDRPIRPLFPSNYMSETQIIANIHSFDENASPEFAAMLGASAALHISDIPFQKPIAGAYIGYVDGEYVLNPTPEQKEKSELDLFMATSKDSITMVEAGAKELSEDIVMNALQFGFKELQPFIEMQEKLRESAGKAKRELPQADTDQKAVDKVKKFAEKHLKEALSIKEKMARYDALDNAKSLIVEHFTAEEAKDPVDVDVVKEVIGDLKSDIIRRNILHRGMRVDGRKSADIRDINTEIDILPRVHGSALFTRGETQALAIVTLGGKDDEQMVDSPYSLSYKNFYLHYNFPPYCVGEVKRQGPPGRREIGHGNLAERGLRVVLPETSSFPYTIRLVSEITESNGSSSMATVCGGSMALMAAGVPVKKPVAGIAMGLVSDGKKNIVLSDILGDEDHVGDMDFKVVGTAEGITALQMDIKIDGLDWKIMAKALDQAKEGRLHILGEMAKCLSSPKTNVSGYAPRFIQHKIATNKIRDIIGPGGSIIKNIQSVSGAKIEIQDTGMINISSKNQKSAEKALAMIQELTKDAQIGTVYDGTIKKITDFGMFIECFPGTEGLLHISELREIGINEISEAYSEGQGIRIKAASFDRNGKLKLTLKGV